MSAFDRIEEIVRHTDTAYLDEHYAWDTDPHQIAAELVDAVRAELTAEEATPAGATATPGPTGRVAQLLDAIRTAGGRWTTVTAFRFYRDHLRALDHIPNTQLRAVARGDLRDLAAWGHLIRHEEPGRQYYLLKTRKDTGQ